MIGYNFFNFFFGFVIQVLPCALLCIMPIRKKMSLTRRKLSIFGFCFVFSAILFSGVSTFLTFLCLSRHMLNQSVLHYLINTIFILFVLLFFAVYAIYVKIRFSEKLFLFLFSFEYGMCIAVFSMIFSVFEKDNIWLQNSIPYSNGAVLFLLFVNIILYPCFFQVLLPLYRLLENPDMRKDSSPSKVFLIPVPFIIITLLCSILPDTELLRNPLFILLLGALILAQLILYWAISNYISSSVQYAHQERQYQMTLESYRILSKNMESLRIFRHEYNRQLFTIAAYLQNQKYEEAAAYIDTLQKAPALEAPLVYCRHTLVNSLLVYFLSGLTSVEVTTKAVLPDTFPISDDHIIGILYNILQNAVEACEEAAADPSYQKKVFLHLNLYIRQENLVILCENSLSHAIQKNSSGKIISSKKDPEKHGFGLKVIENIVHLHDGIIEYNVLLDTFQTSIALHLDYTNEQNKEVS